MRVVTGGYRRRRLNDGAGFVWFTLVALPFVMLSMAISVDFTRIVMTGHAMDNATNSAAIAGAWEFAPGAAVLEPTRAEMAAQQTFCKATESIGGQEADPAYASTAHCPRPTGLQVRLLDHVTEDLTGNPPRPGTGYRTLEATAHYRVVDTIFFGYFTPERSFTAKPIRQAASVCIPEVDFNYTDGLCNRPPAARR